MGMFARTHHFIVRRSRNLRQNGHETTIFGNIGTVTLWYIQKTVTDGIT